MKRFWLLYPLTLIVTNVLSLGILLLILYIISLVNMDIVDSITEYDVPIMLTLFMLNFYIAYKLNKLIYNSSKFALVRSKDEAESVERWRKKQNKAMLLLVEREERRTKIKEKANKAKKIAIVIAGKTFEISYWIIVLLWGLLPVLLIIIIVLLIILLAK